MTPLETVSRWCSFALHQQTDDARNLSLTSHQILPLRGWGCCLCKYIARAQRQPGKAIGWSFVEMTLRRTFKVVKGMSDDAGNLDRMQTPPAAEIEWDYSNSRLRSGLKRKLISKRKTPRDMRALANKLKQGCDENDMESFFSPIRLRPRSYHCRSSGQPETKESRRAKKAAQARERLRTLALQLQAFETAEQQSDPDREELLALCEGIDSEVWDSDVGETEKTSGRLTGCTSDEVCERTENDPGDGVVEEPLSSCAERRQEGLNSRSSFLSQAADQETEIRFVGPKLYGNCTGGYRGVHFKPYRSHDLRNGQTKNTKIETYPSTVHSTIGHP